MKLNFTQQIWEVIEKAVTYKTLPYTTAVHEHLRLLISRIPEPPESSTKSNKKKLVSRMQREIGFLKYIFNNVEDKLRNSNSLFIHYEQIEAFEMVLNRKILKNPRYVKIAMLYGIIRLSDFEITRLINGSQASDDSEEDLVQVVGCRMDGDEVVPLMSHEKAAFYGLYIGRPGRYVHIHDLPTYPDAMYAAAKMVSGGSVIAIDDGTFYDN